MKHVALVDTDSIVHAAGNVTQDVLYEIDGESFRTPTLFKEYCESRGEPQDPKLYRIVYPEPVENALSVTKQILFSIEETLDPDELEVWIAPDDSYHFRYKVFPEYKYRRKDLFKPYHFDNIREYLCSTWMAEKPEKMETDDIISIRARELRKDGDKVTIVTVDKDLDQIGGDFYNWKNKEHHHVTNSEAWRLLAAQAASGDSTDDIPGLPGVGPVKARKIVAASTTVRSALEAVQEEYVKTYGEEKGQRQFKINLRLVALLRSRKELDKYDE